MEIEKILKRIANIKKNSKGHTFFELHKDFQDVYLLISSLDSYKKQLNDIRHKIEQKKKCSIYKKELKNLNFILTKIEEEIFRKEREIEKELKKLYKKYKFFDTEKEFIDKMKKILAKLFIYELYFDFNKKKGI